MSLISRRALAGQLWQAIRLTQPNNLQPAGFTITADDGSGILKPYGLGDTLKLTPPDQLHGYSRIDVASTIQGQTAVAVWTDPANMALGEGLMTMQVAGTTVVSVDMTAVVSYLRLRGYVKS